jgi:S-(hydroxymethyl)glutathione dehydrogenase/alcohol dehydrogenase
MVRALLATAPGEPLTVGEIELPEPGPGEVRVAVAAAGVCHSDLSFYNGTVPARYPVVLGHEAAGSVLAVGEGVTRVRPGDPVALNWAPPCRECWHCTEGEPYLCSRTDTMPSRGSLPDGTPVHACLGLGAFAEEVLVPEKAVVPLPPGIPPVVGALLGCAVLTGVGAVRNTAGVRPGQSVVVLGLGGVGLSVIAGARLAGAGPIIAVDLAAAKEPLARAMGATDFLRPSDTLTKEVRALTGGRGADYAFECVGKGATIRAAWSATRRGGHCTVLGMGRADDPVPLSALEVFHWARTLTTGVYGSADPDWDLPILAEQVLNGTLDLSPLVTDEIGLDGVPAAFERMERGEGARSVVVL